MKSETYFLLAILIAMVAAIVIGINFSFWQAKLAPLIVSGIIVILGAFQLRREISALPSEDTDNRSGEDAAPSGEKPGGYIIQSLWMIGFAAGAFLFGLLPAIIVFCLSYMTAHGASVPKAVIVTVSITCVVYAVFSYILELQLYPGMIMARFFG